MYLTLVPTDPDEPVPRDLFSSRVKDLNTSEHWRVRIVKGTKGGVFLDEYLEDHEPVGWDAVVSDSGDVVVAGSITELAEEQTQYQFMILPDLPSGPYP